MKRHNPYRSLALLLVLCLAVTAHGQTGLERLAVHDVFSGQLADTRILSETHVTGDELAKYHLSVFHSVQCNTSAKGFAQAERLLTQDEQKATEKNLAPSIDKALTRLDELWEGKDNGDKMRINEVRRVLMNVKEQLISKGE